MIRFSCHLKQTPRISVMTGKKRSDITTFHVGFSYSSFLVFIVALELSIFYSTSIG